MKQRIRKIVMILICLSLIIINGLTVYAQDSEEYVDGSYLTNAESSEITMEGLTRGIYYKSGSSTIVKAGTGKVSAGGTTIAQSIVSNVSVSVRVERLVNGSWQVYTSWSATRYNAASASSSKTISVPTGYYYRTHCYHTANSDASTSISNGIWI